MSDVAPWRPEAARLVAPSRTGRWVRLLPVTLQAVDFLYQLATDEASGFRWRLSGTVPTIDAFRESLWPGVLAQFVVVEKQSVTPIGTVVAYNADLNSGHCYVGAAMVDAVQHTGMGIESVVLFLRYLFATWALRKVYLDVPEFNLASMMAGVGTILHEEGRLREHTHYAGRYWDRVTLAVYRTELETCSFPLRRSGRSRPQPEATGS